jgi:hypothetical protein
MEQILYVTYREMKMDILLKTLLANDAHCDSLTTERIHSCSHICCNGCSFLSQSHGTEPTSSSQTFHRVHST